MFPTSASIAARVLAQAQRSRCYALTALQANQPFLSPLHHLSALRTSQLNAQTLDAWRGRPAAAFASGVVPIFGFLFMLKHLP